MSLWVSSAIVLLSMLSVPALARKLHRCHFLDTFEQNSLLVPSSQQTVLCMSKGERLKATMVYLPAHILYINAGLCSVVRRWYTNNKTQ